MVKGTTKSGFHYAVDETILDSWQFVAKLRDVQVEDKLQASAAVIDLVELVLGKDQTQRLARYLAKGQATVGAEAMIAEYKEIVAQVRGAGKAKNSPSSPT
jgi:hypothetical protein